MKEDYNIPTESKVMRIIMDYLQENNDVHDAVFKQIRCLRCNPYRQREYIVQEK